MIRPVLALMLLAAPASAGTCRLVSEAKVILDAPCGLEVFDTEGSFTATFDDEPVFVTVLVAPGGAAEGYWNGGDPQSTHAHDPLGPLTRDGDCWFGEAATVCARE